MKYLELNDLLESGADIGRGPGLDVNGIRFDAEYSAIVKQADGEAAFVDSAQLGDIYIVANGFWVKLDKNYLQTTRRSLYNALLTSLEAEALRQANNTPDYKWSAQEEEVA